MGFRIAFRLTNYLGPTLSCEGVIVLAIMRERASEQNKG